MGRGGYLAKSKQKRGESTRLETRNELRTLFSLEKIDNYGAYQSGHSVIAEFYDNELQVVEAETDYQIASNFIAYNGLNIGEGFTEFERYDAVEKAILDNNGILNEDDAISLLAEVGVRDREVDKLQWSVVYNLATGDVRLFIHRDTGSITAAKLEMKNLRGV